MGKGRGCAALRRWMKEHEVSALELAAASGITLSLVYKIATEARVRQSAVHVIRIAEVTGLDPVELLTGEAMDALQELRERGEERARVLAARDRREWRMRTWERRRMRNRELDADEIELARVLREGG